MSSYEEGEFKRLILAFLLANLLIISVLAIGYYRITHPDTGLSQALQVYKDPPSTADARRCYDGFEFPPCERQDELEMYTIPSTAPLRVQCPDMPINERLVLQVKHDLDHIFADGRDGSLPYVQGLNSNNDTISFQFRSRFSRDTFAAYKPASTDGQSYLVLEVRTPAVDGAESINVTDYDFDGCYDSMRSGTWWPQVSQDSVSESWMDESGWMVYRDLVLDLRSQIHRP